MKRLLCIVGSMDMGGAETFLMKIYRALDRSKYQMDFCVSSNKKGYYDDEIKTLGGKIYHTTPKTKSPLASFKSIYKIVKDNNYNYVLRASQNSLSALELLAAKRAGAKVRVFRSTNSRTMRGGIENVIHAFFRPLVKNVANVKLAPSKLAAEFMFSKRKDVIILKNGIALNDFTYDDVYNKKTRKELGIDEDAFVVGHIGRFSEQKNHSKIIGVFDEIVKKKPNAILVLVGKGELEDMVKKQINELGIEKNVFMLGIRGDVNKLLSIFDVFLFPSLYEGMPNTVIEAQANGVSCVISKTITDEVKICDNVFMLDLDKSDSYWCNKCLFAPTRDMHKNNVEKLSKCGYNIDDVAKEFISIVYGREE